MTVLDELEHRASDAAEVGRRIRGARAVYGLSQVDLAARLGCSRRALQLWEQGATSLHGHHRRALSRVTGLPVACFTVAPSAEPDS